MDPFAYLSQPAYQFAGIALIGIFCLCLRRYRTGFAFVATGLLWLTLCATPAFASWLQRGLEARYPATDASAYPTADAIVVLGGGPLPRLGDDSEQNAATRSTRAGFGLSLYRHAKAPLVLLSGGEREAMQMAQRLKQQGVSADALLTETISMNTHQNALNCAPILRERKLQRILLVTSPLHMRRAAATFRKQGFSVIPAPTAEAGEPTSSEQAWWPRRNTLRLTRRCLREYFGWWIYRLFGWA